ncbi:hypothetical protein [Paracoccus aminophilus]|uniref:Peptidoglycan binding-like domain-containing protein n=1 Tax=Paracoccus aminophilus JCM 7686 TaxID=1367847 RepID=S5Y1Z3_PARAH|nr:hypothetical protein [Paracoccus aminophilus]AGT11477.1 hypothetical protein JCM7686_pAMI6p147 [Paracoccus aminophilus JCM 7686]
MGLRHSLAMLLCALLGATPALARDLVIVPGRQGGQDLDWVEAEWKKRGDAVRRETADRLGASAVPEVIYYSGPVERDVQGLRLASPAGEIGLAGVLGQSGTVVVLNGCGARMDVTADALPASGDWTVVFPVSAACAPDYVARAVLGAMTGDPAGWENKLRATGLVVLRRQDRAAANQLAEVQTVAHDSIVITTLSPKRDTGPRIVAQEISARPRDIPEAVPAVLAAPQIGTTADRSIQPQARGLPAPAIIVGETPAAPDVASAPDAPARGPLGVPYAERASLRAADGARYRTLLDAGAFDPEPAQMAAAIQTELRRMGCYSTTVDGVWGRGSVQAVDRYFAAARGTSPGAAADAALYRAILAGPDLTCPAPPAATTPVAVQPQPDRNTPARTGAGTRRTTAPAGTQARPSGAGRAPRPQAPEPTRPRIGPSFGGTGLFR